MSKSKLLTSLLALMLSACATTVPSDFASEKLTQADHHIPDSWLLPIKGETTDPTQWAKIYDDTILLKYLHQAKSENFDIRIAQSRVEQSNANLRRANALLKPSLGLSAGSSGNAVVRDLGGINDAYNISLNGRWSPDIFGQNRLTIEQSEAAMAVQKALSADTTQAVMATTARAYIRAVEAQMQVSLAKTNLEFLGESRRISEARYRLGDTAKGAFSFAEANYQSALASYENTRQSARQSKRALSILLGDFPVNDLELAEKLKAPREFPARALPAQILERRPDIIAARAQVSQRFAALRGSELSHWPSPSISGGLSSGGGFSDLFNPSAYIARLSASLAQTIFDGGAINADIEASKAALEQSVFSYESRLRKAMGEITNAFDRAQTLRRTLVNLEQSSRAANEALRLESIQYDLGESSLLDVLQVQTRVNAIDASLIRTQAALIETLITANESVAGFLPDTF